MASERDSYAAEEKEMEELEAEVTEMAQRVSNYRATLPPQLMAPLASALASHRPFVSTNIANMAESGPSNNLTGAEGVPFLEEDLETVERAHVLKQKISDNSSAIPVLLKRMRDVTSRLEKLDSCNLVIPPIYKRKRTS